MSQYGESGDNERDSAPIQPVSFRPSAVTVAEQKSGWRRMPLLAVLLLAGLVLMAWYLFSARSVQLRIEPDPDTVSIRGGLPPLPIGGRYIIHSGDYTLEARKAGYHDLVKDIHVSEQATQSMEFSMQKLPGYLNLTTIPATSAKVLIDGNETGTAPLKDLELQHGEYEVMLTTDRYKPFRQVIKIEGEGKRLDMNAELVPDWADIQLSSEPADAKILIDGNPVGTTPMIAEVPAGQRVVTLSKPGYKPWRRELQVRANESQVLPTAKLLRADGKIAVNSTPEGASITVNGEYRGRTPAELSLPPHQSYRISMSKSGYAKTEQTLSVDSGEQSDINVRLQPLFGEIRVTSNIADAELLVDGVVKGSANQSLKLSAVSHRLEVRKAGYQNYETTVTPRPGFVQEISANLVSITQPRPVKKANPTTMEIINGHTLRLIKPGTFTMGASRREQGRRANENLRNIELTRSFYISTTEVTNQQFRKLKIGHSSGVAQRVSLDRDEYPVVNVTWQDAANYCNWLSKQESLPPAYVEKDGKLIASNPLTIGYRLPTEAEWAWVARNEAGPESRKYPWGDAMPPPAKAGNYADSSASDLLATTIKSYTDGYAATSPVSTFSPNSLGLYDLGGNAAEWMQDFYAVYPNSAGKTFTDPSGPASGSFHVIRGSSWQHATISELRLSYRDYGDKARPDVGFRIARLAE